MAETGGNAAGQSSGTGANQAGGPRPEYYSTIEYNREADPPRLDYVRSAESGTPPVDMRALRRQIDDVARLVRILFQDDETRRDEFFGQLHMTADLGLRGRDYNVEAGLENLQDVKDSITDAFPVIRGTIWWWNLALLLGIIVLCLAAIGAYRCYTGSWFQVPKTGSSVELSLLLAVFLIPLGVVVGLFAEYVFRVNDDIPYEQLRAINPGRWKPVQRALNTLVVAWIFAGILGIGAFQVGVANVLLNDFLKNPILSLAIGFVTGFAFPYVRDLVQQFRPARRDTTT